MQSDVIRWLIAIVCVLSCFTAIITATITVCLYTSFIRMGPETYSNDAPSNMLSNMPPAVSSLGSGQDGLSTAVNVVQYMLMNKLSPAVPEISARPSRVFLCWAANMNTIGSSVTNIQDMKFNIVARILEQYGWISDSDHQSLTVQLPTPHVLAAAVRNRTKMRYTSVNSKAALQAIDDGFPVIADLFVYSIVDGDDRWRNNSLWKLPALNHILPIPSATAKPLGQIIAIICGYDVGKQAFYARGEAQTGWFYVPYAYFTSCRTYAFAIDGIAAAPLPSPLPGTSVVVTVVPGSPTLVTTSGDGCLMKIAQEVANAGCPYNDAYILVYDMAAACLVGACKLSFQRAVSGFTMSLSAFLAPRMSMTLVVDGLSTTLTGNANYCADTSATFQQFQSVAFMYK